MFATMTTQVVPRLGGFVERLRGSGDGAKAKRGALLAFAIRVASAGLAYLSQILLARWIGAFEFGIFAYVWVFVLILGGLSTVGLNTSVLRFLPEYRDSGKLALLRGFVASSRMVTGAVSVLLLAAGIGVTLALQGTMSDYYLVPLVIAFFCLPGYALTDVQDGIGRAESWIDLALMPPYLLRPTLLLVLLGLAVAAGFGANAVTALCAALIATYATAIVQTVLMSKRWRERGEAGPREFAFPLWLVVSAPILLMHSFFMLMQHVDVLILNAFVGPADIAVYYAAIKTTSLVAFIHFAVIAAFSSRFAEYHAAGRRDALADHVAEAVKWCFWPSLLATAGLLACGMPLLWLFGPDFTAGYPVMFIFAIGLLTRAAVGPAEMLLSVLGHQNICAAVMAVALAANIAMNFILIPRFGALGAASATVVAIAVESAFLFWLVKRRLGLHVFVLSWKSASPVTARGEE